MTKKLLHITTDNKTPVTTVETTDVSTGASFSGRIPELDGNGRFDTSLFRDDSITGAKLVVGGGFSAYGASALQTYISNDAPNSGWGNLDGVAGDISWTLNSGDLEARVSSSSGICRVLSRLTSDNTVGNSTSEGTLFSYTVPANTMGSDRSIRLTLGGTMFVNSGITNMTLRVKIGSQTLYQDLVGIANSGTTRAFRIVLEISNRTASTQRMSGQVNIGAAAAAAAGTGDIATAQLIAAPIVGASGSVDTTANQAIAVTAQWNNANPAITMTAQYGILELV